MKILYDITGVSSSNVTSEQTGYELDKALDYEKPRDKWRSEDLAEQTITLNFTGDVDCIALFGGNFTDITINGSPVNLALDRLTRTYKGFFTFTPVSSSIDIVIAAQSVLEAYYTLSGIVIGNYEEVCNSIFPVNRSWMQQIHGVKLEGGWMSEEPKDNGYNIIEIVRNKQERNSLIEFNNLKKIVEKTEIFVLYEDMGIINRCYLCRRTDARTYSENRHDRYTDNIKLRELAA